jgi:DHA2 family multidrug resistance protein
MAMALFAMAVMLGPALGPTLGGYIVDNLHWSWIFFINMPVGVVGLLMVWRFVHEDVEIRARNQELADRERKNIDWSGIVLLSVGLSAVEYVLEEGGRDEWFQSQLIVALTFLAVICLIAFVIRELTAQLPAVNLRLFKDPTFASGTVIGGLMFAMLMANMFLLPIFMQELLGFTATQSGVALMPRTLVMMVAVPIVGKFYSKIDPRLVIASGVVFYTAGAWDMSHMNLDSTAWDVVGSLAIQGLGFACLFVPLTTVALSKVPRMKIADATGINSLLRQIGGAVGLAIFATLLDHDSTVAADTIKTHLTATSPYVQARLAHDAAAVQMLGIDAARAHGVALGGLARSVAMQGSVIAFDRMFLLAGILFIFVMPLLLLLKVDRKSLTSEVHLE